MNYRQKHEKLIQILSESSFENFLESLAAVEYNLFLNSNEESKCVVPLKADFELPNVFLKTRKNFKVEKIFSNPGLKANWNKEIDKVLEIIETIDLDVDQETKVADTDEKLLEKIIKYSIIRLQNNYMLAQIGNEEKINQRHWSISFDYRRGVEEDTVKQISKLSNEVEPDDVPVETKVEKEDNKKVVTD